MKTDKQRQVLNYLQTVEKASLEDIYSNVNFGYYHNWAKHLGVLLKRMIDNGTIERVGRGVYKFKRERKFYEPNNENQINLF